MNKFTKATLILGADEKGNDIGYFQSGGDWYNLASEMKVTPRFIINTIYPLVLLVRFGDEPMTVFDWRRGGWPVELSAEEMEGLRRLNNGETLVDPRTPAQKELDDMAQDWNAQVTELRGGI